ncbi:hypothetical protein PUV47_02040 [Pseudovibrio exalbescens]|uniref:hypothetical protein n=1 Tax=Pseudovibrio exalbescens TaxID=197461 RepID=UPI00236693BF|nr:hypothetical protein [Pseudovibrio exalbescens]MDD7908685.1 hypothetical protein [Pseudovibrio exalbescens]
MSLSILLPILTEVGVPLLRNVVGRALGAPAGEIASGVVTLIADSLGVERTPEAIANKYNRDPQDVAESLRYVETSQKEFLVTMLDTINQTMQKEQNARGLLTRIWRPVFGLIFGMVYGLLGFCLVYAIATSADPIQALGLIGGYLTTYLACGTSVLGVYVWQRSAEKKQGVA